MSVIERERVVTEEDVRHHAADLIEEHGWSQGSGRFTEGPFCLGTAAQTSVKDLCGEDDSILLGKAYTHMGLQAGRDMVEFNDTPGRTQEEVIARLRA